MAKFLDEAGLEALWGRIKAADESVLAKDVKIEIGSYTSTGVYGASNPNTLTFGFTPKIWGVYRVTRDFYNPKDGGTGCFTYPVFCFFKWGQTSRDGETGIFYNGSLQGNRLMMSYSGNTVSWYSDAGTFQQLNAADTCCTFIYEYFAIG